MVQMGDPVPWGIKCRCGSGTYKNGDPVQTEDPAQTRDRGSGADGGSSADAEFPIDSITEFGPSYGSAAA